MSETYEPPKGKDVGIDFFGNYAAPKGGSVGLDFPFNRCRYIYYKPPKGNKVGLNFTEPYTPPLGNSVGINFTNCPDGDQEPKDEQFLHPTGLDSLTVGGHTVYNSDQHVRPSGIAPTLSIGTPTIYNAADAIYPPSLGVLTAYGQSTLYNSDQHVKPSGIAVPSLSVSATRVSNWINYIKPTGGVWSLYGTTSVVNTTANQAVFNATVGSTLQFGTLKINNANAYTVRPDSINDTRYGTPRIFTYHINVEFTDFFESGYAQVNQRIHHSGKQSSVISEDTQLELGDRTVQMHGVDHLTVGIPSRVFDPAQTISNVGIAAVGLVGGASRVVNYTNYIEPRGYDYFISQQWHTVHSNRREVTVRSASEMTSYGMTTVTNYASDFRLHGWLDSLIGSPTVWYDIRSINLWSYGVQPLGIGTPALRNLNRYVTLTGIAPPVLPTNANVTNAVRFLNGHGLDSAEWGDVWVSESPRYVTPTSRNHAEYGVEHTVTNEWRTLLGRGTSFTAIGTLSVEYHTRTVFMVGRDLFDTSSYSVRLKVHHIRPRGEVYTAFGTSIKPQQQVLWFRGISAPNASIPDVQNKNRIVSMWSVGDTFRHGILGNVFNSDQYVDYHDKAIEPPLTYRSIHVVEYRTKFITPRWSGAVRYGTNHLYNTARVVSMEGEDLSHIGGASLVADGVRYLRPHGISPTPIMRYTAVHNDAYVISTHGTDSSEYGTSWVHSLDQHIKPYQFDTSEYGRPWVSESPRSIQVFSFSHYFAPHPTVELGSRQLFVQSVYGSSIPSHRTSVVEHRDIITFRYGIDSAVYGRNHEVWNVTPEITRVGAYDGHAIGTPSVRTQWRNIIMRGAEHFYSPRHTVEFTLRTVLMRGNEMTRYGSGSVVNDAPDGAILPTRETIAPSGIFWRTESDRWGNHTVIENAVINVTAGNTFTAGSPTIIPKIQVVEFRTGVGAKLVTSIESVTLGIRTIAPHGMNYTIEVTQGGYATGLRMSPHTIYCTNDTPAQIRESYAHIIPDKGWLDPYDTIVERNPQRPQIGVGYHTIRHDREPTQTMPRNLTIGNTFVSGRPTVDTTGGRINYQGYTEWRIGWVTVLPHTGYVDLYDSVQHDEYGHAEVKHSDRPFAQTVPPVSIEPMPFGTFRIEHFHRTVYGLGDQHTVYGRRATQGSFTWDGFAVSPPRPTIPRGITSTLRVGEHWVSHAPRVVEMQGLYTFKSEYSLEDFTQRMRVREVNRPEQYPTQHIKPISIASEQHVAVPDMQLMRYYIRPDGWTDMYIKGINGVSHG